MNRIIPTLIAWTLSLCLVVGIAGCQIKPAAQPTQEPVAATKYVPPSAPMDVSYFLRRMVDLEWLFGHEPGVTCKQFSSYDRQTRIDEKGNRINWEANGDCGHFLRKNATEGNVMAEMDGPGCITQIWSANPGGTVRIWLDGEENPSIVIPMLELLSDQGQPPFNEPYSYQARPAPGNSASNCYFPIPYAKSCKIAVVGAEMYYHVDYITYPTGAPVVTLKLPLSAEQQKVCDEVAAQIRRNAPVLPQKLQKIQVTTHNIKPGGEGDLLRLPKSGGGVVREFSLSLASPDKSLLRKAVLKIYFDEAQEPGVVTPLSEFFGTGWYATPFESLLCRIDDKGGMTSYFPMPFRKSFRASVTNMSKTPLTVSAVVQVAPASKAIQGPPMYFHAMYRRENLGTTFDYPFVENLFGAGRYVGTLLNIDNPQRGWWGEGDEKVWVDDDKFPSWFGTGSEDYFNDAWGMHRHNRPYEGCPLIQEPDGHHRKTSMYRWHILDSIPFSKQFTMTIENYYKHWGRVPSDYSSVAYYYDMRREGPDLFKPLTLADLLPCNFRPAGTIEAETMAFPAESKRTLEQLTELDLADQTSGTGAVLLWAEPSKPAMLPLGDLKAGVYRLHVYLLSKTEAPGLVVKAFDIKGPDGKPLAWFVPGKVAEKIAAGGSSQELGVIVITGDKPVAMAFPLATSAGTNLLLDAVRLDAAPRREMEAESIKWSSPDHLVTIENEYGNPQLSGWGHVKLDSYSIGGLASINVNLKPGVYEVEAGLGCGPDFGQLRVRYELLPRQLVTYDGYAEKAGQRVHNFGRFEVKDQPLKQLTFMVCGKNPASKGTKMTIDWIEIRPCRTLWGYEGESMKVLKIEHGEVGPQELGTAFSGRTQQWVRFGDEKGVVQLGFNVPQIGKYDIVMAFCKSFDYAIVQTFIDGKPIGQRIDMYNPTVIPTGPMKLGTLDLTPGNHLLEFRAVGKNKESKGYYMGLDYMDLVPVKP